MPAQRRTNKCVVRDGTAYVDVSTRKHPNVWTAVDLADLPLVHDGRGRWSAHKIGRCATLYVDRYCKHDDGRGEAQRLHRVLTGVQGRSAAIVDHADGDGLNNRQSNLRVTSYGRNKSNSVKRRLGTSRYKGVHATDREWKAAIRCDHKRYYLGRFATEEEAARAYDAAAQRLFGEFACLNFRPLEGADQ